MQLELLDIMRKADTIAELKNLHKQMHHTFWTLGDKLQTGNVSWRELLLRKTIGKSIENTQSRMLAFFHCSNWKPRKLQSNREKIRYVVPKKTIETSQNVISPEEMAELSLGSSICSYDIDYYTRLLWDAFQEIWENFAPEGYFRFTPAKQLLFEF